MKWLIEKLALEYYFRSINIIAYRDKYLTGYLKLTGTCQSVKGSCNLFIEPQLTTFLFLYNFPHVFKIFIAYHSMWWYQENLLDR